jgi:hypothetical protein
LHRQAHTAARDNGEIEMFEQSQVGLGLDLARMWQRWLLGLLFVACLIATASFSPLYIMGVAFAGLIIWDTLRQRARTQEVRQLAQRMGFTYIGSAVPRSFPLQMTSSGSARSISRAVAGDRDNKELVLFDCMLGHGRARFYRTVVAVRGQDSVFGIARFGPDLVTEQVGEWALVYGDRRLLLIEEIEALVSAV